MTARRQPSSNGKRQPGGPGAKRAGQGQPADQDKWPPFGPVRDWLAYCDQVHQANGTLSLRTLAKSLDIEFGRVGELLRGDGLPVNEEQARALLEALGAVGSEVDKGVGLYKDARDGRSGWRLPPGYADQVATSSRTNCWAGTPSWPSWPPGAPMGTRRTYGGRPGRGRGRPR